MKDINHLLAYEMTGQALALLMCKDWYTRLYPTHTYAYASKSVPSLEIQ
jgi:hypothetical protein